MRRAPEVAFPWEEPPELDIYVTDQLLFRVSV
jgi:hypothetical protein